MKLTKLIIDPNMNLIGFMVKGKAKEFGEMGTSEYERPIAIRYLMNTKFNNNQAYFENGKITEKNGFHINQLGMLLASGETMTEIPNTIELTKRFVRNNENIGFEVKFGNGDLGKYKYDDVMRLAELFKPVNFVIKFNAQGKQFIAGKSGQSLAKLPMVVIEGTSDAKRTKSGAKTIAPVTGGKMRNDIDILDIFDFVRGCNGFIINFHDTEYKATSDVLVGAAENFKSMKIGEVGNPYLDFNETKFNASCKFRDPGVISLSPETSGPVFAGSANLVYTFVYRTKNLFFNGEHHLSRIGVIIPNEKVHDLFEEFSSSMAITEVTDEKVIQVVNRLINWKDSKIFEVDTSKLDMISPAKYDKYIMTPEQIYKNTLNIANSKIALKYIRGAIKEINELAGVYSAPKNKPIAPQFALKSEDELRNIIMAGVDIYTGAFIDKGEAVKNKSSKAGEAVAEVSYIIEGLDPKNFTFAKIKDQPEKNPESVNSMIAKVENIADLRSRLEMLNELQKQLETVEAKNKREIWLHKASMWMKAGKLGVHKDDAANWEVNTKKRTKAICYDCKVPSAKGLQLLVLNTDIVK